MKSDEEHESRDGSSSTRSMRPWMKELSTPGLFCATVYVGLALCTVAYGILFTDSPTELPLLAVALAVVLLLPWVLIAVPLSFLLEAEIEAPLVVVFAIVNTVLAYRLGKKLGRYFAA